LLEVSVLFIFSLPVGFPIDEKSHPFLFESTEIPNCRQNPSL
jgi:hypothetical protein